MRTQTKGGIVAAIVESIEISRAPEDVFSYLTDPARLPDWQESLVDSSLEGDGPVAVGSRFAQTRNVGRGERKMTLEMTRLDPPRRFAVRGIDGPVRGMVEGTVEPLEDGARSRVTLELSFEGHGIGKILVPLMVQRQARSEMPKNMQSLKAQLEHD
jgi:uncharacterized protein YndB with AHSA1/START domain